MAKFQRAHGGGIVYRAINLVTGDFYIGITVGYLSQRKSKHIQVALKKNSQFHFHRAIRKYGKDNFEFDVLKKCSSYEEAKQEEIKLIAELKPRYNMTLGGDGTLGFKLTREQIERGAAKRRGLPGYWKGKKLLPHVVEFLRHRGKTRPDKLRILALGPKSIMKEVVCLDDGLVFECARRAAEHYGISCGVISSVCNKGRHKTAGGLVFRYTKDSHEGKREADLIRWGVLASRQRTAAIARHSRSIGSPWEVVIP